ncbi:MAG: magnesium and cobalt transport protein CorA [Actinomycetota bacterium]|nr:magnesium and cobalt transport protein CorA [Actinomycetota bacterium]
MIRGLGVYSPDGVVPIDDIGCGQEPADEHPAPKLENLRARCDEHPESFVWLGLFEPTKDELDIITRVFDLSHLQVEDAANPNQRAKFDFDSAGHGLAILKVLDYYEPSSDVNTGQIAVFVGSWFVITVRFGEVGDLQGLRPRLEMSANLRAMGPVSVFYAVFDKVVDEYLAVSDEVSIDVEELEQAVFQPGKRIEYADRIYRLKRENVEVRGAVNPLVPVAHDLVQEYIEWIPVGIRPYFRDIGEHVLRVHDSVEGTDSMLLTMLMAATSQQDLQQNKDMRKISAWVAIAAVPTMIAGIYGMNFENLPELHWRFGYFMVMGLMAGACTLLYRAFRKSGWL